MSDIPFIDLENLDETLYQSTNDGLSPERPFDGQAHTEQGERGESLVEGLRFRDVADCFVIGWLHASGKGGLVWSGTASYNDVYDGKEDPDPLAVMQNMLCEMERRMGIFPNIGPKAEAEHAAFLKAIADTGAEE